MPEIHKSLTSFEKFNTGLPFYVDNLFTEEELIQLKNIIYTNKDMLRPIVQRPREQTEEAHYFRFRPKHVQHMSRAMVEFIMPKNLEAKLDILAKPLHKDPIALCHYNYIEYNKKFSEGKKDPILPPHVDADENLITINYCMGGNINWDLYIGNEEDGTKFTKYSLDPGQTLVFSAVNQVHWRPRRKFADGEFLEILSMDYCPVTNYRFTGELNPLDGNLYPEVRRQQQLELNETPQFKSAWSLYKELAIRDGLEVEN
jgi:hypothetical protein